LVFIPAGTNTVGEGGTLFLACGIHQGVRGIASQASIHVVILLGRLVSTGFTTCGLALLAFIWAIRALTEAITTGLAPFGVSCLAF
jgi:hypothetical protein